MKKIPQYTPRWLSGFLSFLRSLPIPLWIVAFGVIFFVGLALHVDVWRRGLLPPGQIASGLAAEGLWLTFLPGLWLYLDQRAYVAIEGFLTEKRKMVDLEKILAEFLSLPPVSSAVFFLLGSLFGILVFLSIAEASPLFASVAWEGIPNAIFTTGLLTLFVFRAIRQAVLIGRLLATEKVHLFNPQPIFALSRYSSQSTLAIILTFYMLIFISGASDLKSIPAALLSPALVSLQLVLLGAGILLFFIPLRNVNHHLRAEKGRLLAEYGKDLDLLYGMAMEAARNGKLDQVIGLRDTSATLREGWEFVKKLPTWPWEPDSLRNVLSPLLIPIIVFILQRYIGFILGG